MHRESLPLLLALFLPLVGAAGLLPAAGKGSMKPILGPVNAPVENVIVTPVVLQPPAQDAAPLPVAGIWLNF